MKLTNAMRDAIVQHAIEAGRLARSASLERAERALAVRLTKHRYGEDVFERCRALPEGWLNVHRTIAFGYYGNNALSLPSRMEQRQSRHYRFETVRFPSHHKLELDTAVPLPNSFTLAWTRGDLGTMYQDVVAHFERVVLEYDEEKALRQSLRGALLAFSTVERLADGWPEGYAHLPMELLKEALPNHPLPAPRLDDLNKRLVAFRSAA